MCVFYTRVWVTVCQASPGRRLQPRREGSWDKGGGGDPSGRAISQPRKAWVHGEKLNGVGLVASQTCREVVRFPPRG